jgi:hypothetical protein
MRFQQNLAGGWAEHCTARSSYAVIVEKKDDSGRVATGPSMSGCVVPGERACAAPDEWRPRWRQQQQSSGCGLARRGSIGCAVVGEHVAVVEMKAGERCGGEEGMREARRNTVVEHSRGLAR